MSAEARLKERGITLPQPSTRGSRRSRAGVVLEPGDGDGERTPYPREW